MPDTLVIQWARLGDLLHTRPLLDRLKRDCPDEQVCLTCDARHGFIVNRFPEVDRVYLLPIEQFVAHCRTDAMLAEALQQFAGDVFVRTPFRRVINLTNHPAAICFTRLLNADLRLGYGFDAGERWSQLLEARPTFCSSDPNAPVHVSDIWCSGIGATSDAALPNCLEAVEQSVTGKQLTIVCDAGDPLRSLSESTIDTLVNTARDCGHDRIVLVGAQQPQVHSLNVRDLRGKTSLEQLFDILEISSNVIGPDTGALHLAAAIGRPALGFYLNDAQPARTGPYTLDACCVVAKQQDNEFCQTIKKILPTWLREGSGAVCKLEGAYTPRFQNGYLLYETGAAAEIGGSNARDTLSIVIAEFGQVHYTDELLKDLRKCELPADVEIIVVSSGINAADAAYAHGRAGVVSIVSDQALSFAQANNLGVSEATRGWLLLINDDCQVTSSDFGKLWASRRQGIVTAPRLKFWDDVLQSHGIAIDGGEVRDVDAVFEFDCAQADEALVAVSGAAMLMERELFNSLGGFNEDFVNGYEDVDFCLRVKKLGYSVSVAECDLLHYRSSSSGRFEKEDANLCLLNQKWPKQFSRTTKRDAKKFTNCPLLFVSDASALEAGPQIRWISPLERLGGVRGKDYEWIDTHFTNSTQFKTLLDDAENVIVFRSIDRPELCDEVLKWKIKGAGHLLHDCDDLLLNRFASGSMRANSRKNFEDSVCELMTAADACLSPSCALLDLHKVDPHRQMILPSIPMPEHFVESDAASLDGLFRIGYAGGISHQTDLALVLPALEQILEAYPNARFYWWGAYPGALAQHPSVRRGGMWLQNYQMHLNRIQRVPIDLWIAPLADTPHNCVRSPIKAFEYLGNQRLALFSDCEPFKSLFKGEAKALVVHNDLNSWHTAIERAIVRDSDSELTQEGNSVRSRLLQMSTDHSGYETLLRYLHSSAQLKIRQDEMCLA